MHGRIWLIISSALVLAGSGCERSRDGQPREGKQAPLQKRAEAPSLDVGLSPFPELRYGMTRDDIRELLRLYPNPALVRGHYSSLDDGSGSVSYLFNSMERGCESLLDAWVSAHRRAGHFSFRRRQISTPSQVTSCDAWEFSVPTLVCCVAPRSRSGRSVVFGYAAANLVGELTWPDLKPIEFPKD